MTVVTTEIEDDPFAAPADAAPNTHIKDRKRIITGGRYRLPNRDGSHKPYGWMRVTNVSGAISDQKRLQDWEIRTILEGVHARPDLYADLMAYLNVEHDRTRQDYKDNMAEHAEAFKVAGGGNVGAEWGNARHEDWEAFQVSPEVLALPEWERMRAVRVALAEAHLAPVPGWQEQRVLVEEMEAVGTLDNILECQRTGLWHIGDLKTQKRFWSYLEVEAQEAMYAHAVARWVPESADDPTVGRWEDMPPVDQHLGAVMWMPRVREDGIPEVEVKGIDLVRGWRTAELAREVIRRRSEARTTRGNLSGWSWLTMPQAYQIERFARAFGTVETMEDGRKLTDEAKAAGLWGPELRQSAMKAAERIQLNGVDTY